MKKYINFYFDESGSTKSKFFIVGGFYLMSNNNSDIDNYQNKIKANILKIEKVIKKFRHTRETNLTTYYATNENKPSRMDKEIKWNNLSLKNKQYLVNNLKNVNQNNISIICDLENWKTKHNKKINLDAIYNMCIYYIVDRVLSNKIDKNEIKNDDEIIIKIYIDQRKDIPKISSKKQYKLRGLEDYLNTQFYLNSSYENLKSIRINQLNSNYQPLIRLCWVNRFIL